MPSIKYIIESTGEEYTIEYPNSIKVCDNIDDGQDEWVFIPLNPLKENSLLCLCKHGLDVEKYPFEIIITKDGFGICKYLPYSFFRSPMIDKIGIELYNSIK